MARAKKTETKEEKTDLIKMVRDDGHEADVHPEMVEDYKAGGYKEKGAK